MKQIKIDQVMTVEDILLDVSAKDRIDLINQLSRALENHEGVRNVELLAEAAVTRENELSTGLEHGIAMPHARTDSVTKLVTLFVRLEKPIPFEAPDGSDSDLIVFSAVPPTGLDDYLHLVAQLVRKLSLESVRSALREADDVETVLNLLCS